MREKRPLSLCVACNFAASKSPTATTSSVAQTNRGQSVAIASTAPSRPKQAFMDQLNQELFTIRTFFEQFLHKRHDDKTWPGGGEAELPQIHTVPTQQYPSRRYRYCARLPRRAKLHPHPPRCYRSGATPACSPRSIGRPAPGRASNGR